MNRGRVKKQVHNGEFSHAGLRTRHLTAKSYTVGHKPNDFGPFVDLRRQNDRRSGSDFMGLGWIDLESNQAKRPLLTSTAIWAGPKSCEIRFLSELGPPSLDIRAYEVIYVSKQTLNQQRQGADLMSDAPCPAVY
jgi:hypothetical protein